MSTLSIGSPPKAVQVSCSEVELASEQADGRRIAVPIVWFPRLSDAATEQRNTWKSLGEGTGNHWPQIDEDISVAALLVGKLSVEYSRETKQLDE